jgi:small subunit ribosomal protein S17e
MGRIKTKLVKRAGRELMKEHPTEFKKSFTDNKKLVDKFADVKSKKIRNVIAGYVTRKSRTKK